MVTPINGLPLSATDCRPHQVTNQAKLEEFRLRVNAAREKNSKTPAWLSNHRKQQEEMGRWLGEYFDDAGYEGWIYFPELFKAMVMSAFPPIEALDSKAGSSMTTLEDCENAQINFVRVMDHHLASSLGRGEKGSVFAKAAMGVSSS